MIRVQFQSFFYVYLFSWGRDVCTHTQVLVNHSVHVEVRSEDNWWELVLSVPLMSSRGQTRSSGLAAGVFTCWACYLPSSSFAFG